MTDAKQGKIITFYSYKGGTGRSMALANIACILASNSKRVLVVYWDLEAPRLQRYFRPFLVDHELTSSPGVVDLISDFILEAITPLEKGEKLAPDSFLPKTDIDPYVISLNWKFDRGQLDFIPAGRQGPDYGQRFSAINWQKFYYVLGGCAFIEQLKINMRSQYYYILVDSRTGVSDTSGICTIQLPDTLVVCFTLNNQSIEGAASITQGVFDQRSDQYSISSLLFPREEEQSVADWFYLSPHLFKIFPVPMRVDQSERDKLEMRRAYARRKFDPFLYRKRVLDRRAYWGAVTVPYIPYFSYEEILAVFKDDPRDPNTCLAAFTRIATEITEREVTGFVPLISPENRDAVLQDFASVPELARATGAADDGGAAAKNVRFPVTAAFDESAESPLEGSLRRAESTLRSLNEEEREQARLLWMRLVRIPRPGENIENSKVRVPLKQLSADSNPVIQKFANAGVVTVSKDDQSGETTVEVKDEELLRSWPTLDRWIVENRDLMLWRQDLRSSMAQWKEHGRRWFDLMTGRRLWNATRWYRSHRMFLSTDEAAYIRTSFKLFITAYVIVFALVLVAPVGGYFLKKSSDKTRMAESIASIAETQIASATTASQLSPDQFQLGLLLAVEAQQVAANAKAESLLKTNLARLPRKIASIDIKTYVLNLALAPSGSQVLSVTGVPIGSGQLLPDTGTAQLNDLSTGETIIRIPFEGSRTFLPSTDARYLADSVIQGSGSVVEVREATTGKVLMGQQSNNPLRWMAFSPDGTYFATASGNRLLLTNLRDSDRRASPLEFTSTAPVNLMRFSGDSQHLAVTDGSSSVHVLRNISRSARLSYSIKINVDNPNQFWIALSHNGRYLATTALGSSGDLKLWDVETATPIRRYQSAKGPYPIWFSADSKFLVAASDGSILVWDIVSDTKDTGIQYDVNSPILESEDGKYFIAPGDNVSRIWEYNGSSFTEVESLIYKSRPRRFVFGNPNFVVTTGADNFINVFKLREPVTDNLRYEACSRLIRNLTIDEWNTHVASNLGAYRKTCSELP